jgi:short-subunit dehydrogenase
VTPETWDHVESIFYDTLAQFSAILETRPYLLGTRPSLADFGFFGPMFRHFSMDPTSARIMRETAPSVFEWVARMWNARASVTSGELLEHVPDDWAPILDSIGTGYLPYLCANAEAWKAGRSHFNVNIEGAPYRDIRTARYRVWCLEELRRHFEALSEPHQHEVRARLEAHGCWVPLWQVKDLQSGHDPDRKAPFAGSDSATGMSLKDAQKLHWLPVFAARRNKQRTQENMMGKLALITGASSGIGAEFARLHARKGGDLVLVARREEALNALKQELEKAHGISATVLVADLAAPGAAQKIFAATEEAGLQIDILINNAGFGGHGKFHERDLASDQAMMQVNMNALVDLTHLYLQGMVSRNSGKILQVASTAGMIPGPLQAVYYATKAFVISFSQAIAEELSGTGVTSTALCPGAVDTGFVAAGDLEGAALFEKSAASAVSVAECGYEAMLKGDLVKINEPALNFGLNWVIPLLPRKLVLKLSRKTMEKSA